MKDIFDNFLIYLCKKYNSFFKIDNLEQKDIFDALMVKKDRDLHDKLYIEYEIKNAQNLPKYFSNFASDIKNKRVLDYGCGHGGISIAVYNFSPESIHGIDIKEMDISCAQKEVARRGLSNISFSVYNGKKIPFDDEFFDTILLSDVIEHLEDPLNSLIELKRVLKKGGSIFITTFSWYHPHGLHLWSLFPAYWSHLIFPERIITKIRCGTPMKYEDLGFNKMTIRRLNGLIKKVGLTVCFKEYKTRKCFSLFKKIPFLNEFIVSVVLLKVSKE